MGKVFGIDLGTTYSCIAYIDENGKPVVLKNAEGDLTTPSAVFFETQTDVTVGSAAKESAKMYPEQVVTFIKRSIGQPGFSLNLNGIDMKPEEISSYILKKVVKDAEDSLRMEGKLSDDEQIRDVVITCPAYFGVTERDATKAAGVIAGLNVVVIGNGEELYHMKLLKAIFAAMCVGVTLLFLYFENQLSVISLAIAVGFYVVASAIHLVFHECGHFFGGLVSKYKLLFFRFGPFNLVKTEKTKIKFTWLKTHGGQCVMYPSQTSTIKYKAYNLGGVIANAIIAALSTLLMLPNNFYLLMMMIELVFVGAYKILVNLIPHKTNGVPNDGYIVKMLDAHIAMRKDYALYLRIYADTFLNKAISPSDYQYERNESLSDDELLYYNEIQEILKSINAQMSKHEIDHCKGIVI